LEDRDHFLFRIPESLKSEYRPWLRSNYNGWVDATLFDRMTAEQQSHPESVLGQDDAEVARSRRNLTMRIHIGGRPVWVKHFRPSGPVDRFVYAVRPGKAVYAWNAAMALTENGFCTPRPLIGLRSAGSLGGADGIIAFEEIADHRPLDRAVSDESLDASGRDRLMSELGMCLRRFHDLGFRHRDLRQGNILASATGDRWSFCFLDLNRLRVQAPLTRMQRLREVEKLNLTGDGLEAFFSAYMPESGSRDTASLYTRRVDYAHRLEQLPLGKVIRKAWYYTWEVRTFSRARRP